MAHSTSIQPGGSYLHITVTGQNSREDVSGYIREVFEACKQHDCFNVLIEENLRGPSLGPLQMYEIITENLHLLLPFDHHLAYVDVNPEHEASNNQFAETVAVNRGLKMRAFSSIPEAEGWLLEQSKRRA